ncbi:GLNA synthetase, partial [Columbina picui]|nr:GLNA synthetase [Columbina picui]
RAIAMSVSHSSRLNKLVREQYMRLPQDGLVQVTYVWIDGSGEGVRCKRSRHLRGDAHSCPEEERLRAAMVKDGAGSSSNSVMTFSPGENVLSEIPARQLLRWITRAPRVLELLGQRAQCQPYGGWYLGAVGSPCSAVVPPKSFTWVVTPLSFPGPYYCGVGADKVYGRDIVESHYKACLYAGVKICGTNAEVMPSQVRVDGPAQPLFPVMDPNLHEAGLTQQLLRGAKSRQNPTSKLSKRHDYHICVYDPRGGRDNSRRLTGHHETSNIFEFSAGVANRGASIRIPRQVGQDGCGYFEDRRPAANCDPYAVTEAIMRTTVLNETGVETKDYADH